jgi:hypothetical protein
MRIGHDDNFLSIDSDPMLGGYATCRTQAVASASSGRRFTASHDCVMMDASDPVRECFVKFANLGSIQTKIPLSEGGWIHLERDNRGYIIVRYRVGGWKASAAMEGEVFVEGEFANSFCREFGALFSAQA